MLPKDVQDLVPGTCVYVTLALRKELNCSSADLQRREPSIIQAEPMKSNEPRKAEGEAEESIKDVAMEEEAERF